MKMKEQNTDGKGRRIKTFPLPGYEVKNYPITPDSQKGEPRDLVGAGSYDVFLFNLISYALNMTSYLII